MSPPTNDRFRLGPAVRPARGNGGHRPNPVLHGAIIPARKPTFAVKTFHRMRQGPLTLSGVARLH